MLISNNMYKLPAIIYKPGIMYKATTIPINKDRQPYSTNINTGFIDPSTRLNTHSGHEHQARVSLSFAHTSLIKHILVFLC